MSGDSQPDELIEKLRRLAAERPREARALIGQLLDEQPPVLRAFLLRLGAPGESRLRHMVASAVKVAPTRAAAVPQLADWLHIETDEFTKNALRDVVHDTQTQAAMPAPHALRPIQPQFIEAYRYAAERLMHRVRNALAEPQTALLRLNRLASSASGMDDATLRSKIAQITYDLDTGLQRIARVVEFDLGDGQFTNRRIDVVDWIRNMNREYVEKYSSMDVKLDVPLLTMNITIRANDYLLRTIFWNIWTNAQQAVRGPCAINLSFIIHNSTVDIIIIDNGDGFSTEAKEIIFRGTYSGKSGHRGRGLLEVQDAVERLHGEVRLVDLDGKYRLKLTFPMEVS